MVLDDDENNNNFPPNDQLQQMDRNVVIPIIGGHLMNDDDEDNNNNNQLQPQNHHHHYQHDSRPLRCIIAKAYSNNVSMKRNCCMLYQFYKWCLFAHCTVIFICIVPFFFTDLANDVICFHSCIYT